MRPALLALAIALCAMPLSAARIAPAMSQALPIPVAPSRVDPPAASAVPPGRAAGQAPAPGGAPAGLIPPAQAQQVLDLLKDDRRRAEFVATLEALLKAAPPAPGVAPATPAAAGAPPPAASPAAPAAKVAPLAPDSLGAEILERASASLADAGAQLGAAVRSMNDLPLLWRWVTTQASDPVARARVLDTAWKLAAVVLAALLAEWAARRLLRRLRATLGSWAPHPVEPDPQPTLTGDAPAPPGAGHGAWTAAEGDADPGTAGPGAAQARTVQTGIIQTGIIQTGTVPAGAGQAGGSGTGLAQAGAAPDGLTALPPTELADARAGTSGASKAGAADAERAVLRRAHLNRALGTLRRLPYLLGRLALDLVPIGVFAGMAGLLRGTALGQPATTGLVIREVVLAWVLARLVLAVTAFLVSPAAAHLRLLSVSNPTGAFITRWTRRIAVTAISTYAVTEVAVTFGLYNTARDALLKLFALVVHGLLVAAVLQARGPVAARIRAIRVGGVWAALLRRLADVWHLVAIFYIVALWLVWAVELRGGYTRLVTTFLVTCGVLIASRLLAIVLLGGLERGLRPSAALAARHPGLEARVGAYLPVLRLAAMSLLWAATGVALLQAWGFNPLTWFSKGDLGSRILSAGLLIAATTLVAVLVWEGANAGIERHLARLTADAQLARAGRLRTLLPMLRTTLLVVIVLVVSLTVLSEVGVNIAPLLAGAGVVGIAVGFGSQKLVQDLITGLFLLLENAMQVGDVVTLGGLTGTVEALSIRTIRLRALDGAIHIIPFSAVTTVTNQTRDYGYAVLDIQVGLNEEPEPVIEAVRELAARMRAEPRWAPLILDALDVMGVERFVDLAWVLRVRLKTQPASRWSVTRELNRRVKERFDELAIESPLTSHRVLSSNPPPPAVTAPGAANTEPQAA